MKTTLPCAVSLRLPGWVARFVASYDGPLASDEERMRFVVALAGENVERGTGGPFAAAVFGGRPARLLSAGVNLVVRGHCSAAHAEVVALALAQRAAGTHDLAAPGVGPCELVTSTEPCAMCLGAVPWSGVTRVVCGARGKDAEAIGMDEGAKPARWTAGLKRRGIAVRRNVRRAEAREVLRLYALRGGPIYNGKQKS